MRCIPALPPTVPVCSSGGGVVAGMMFCRGAQLQGSPIDTRIIPAGAIKRGPLPSGPQVSNYLMPQVCRLQFQATDQASSLSISTLTIDR